MISDCKYVLDNISFSEVIEENGRTSSQLVLDETNS
jgi:hypothetical protein